MAKIKVNTELDENLYAAYWNNLQQLKFDIFYYDEHFKDCVLISKKIKYVIVGLTSLATGAWIGWSSNSIICIICAIFIWLLQGVSAVSDFFPYENRKQELRDLTAELEPLYIDMETDWRKIQALEISNDGISSRIHKYALHKANIRKHFFKDDALPIKEKLWTRADDMTEEYFKSFK